MAVNLMVQFILSAIDAENLWHLLSTTQVSEIAANERTGRPKTGVPFAVYELRETLSELRDTPEDELDLGSPKRVAYCTERDLSIQYFPKTLTWTVPRRLLVILKLTLKTGAETSTGYGVAQLVDLCATLRLSKWFKQTFKKPLNIDLGEDDCELDDEIEEEKAKEEAKGAEAPVAEVPCEDEKPTAEAAD